MLARDRELRGELAAAAARVAEYAGRVAVLHEKAREAGEKEGSAGAEVFRRMVDKQDKARDEWEQREQVRLVCWCDDAGACTPPDRLARPPTSILGCVLQVTCFDVSDTCTASTHHRHADHTHHIRHPGPHTHHIRHHTHARTDGWTDG